jgi:hypothetical protein
MGVDFGAGEGAIIDRFSIYRKLPLIEYHGMKQLNSWLKNEDAVVAKRGYCSPSSSDSIELLPSFFIAKTCRKFKVPT